MENKVVLTLVDGMRPDGMIKCGNPFVEKLLSVSTYSLTAKTVMPSCTLPCHMSLFHSVDPQRHGVTTNTYIPPVRPIEGIVERLNKYEKKCAFFYTWEELRDLSRPDNLDISLCINQHKQTDTDKKITQAAIEYIKKENPDFLFLYLGQTDELGGHENGWMSEQYFKCIDNAFSCIEDVYNNITEAYTLIVIADHGGHERRHGEDIPEDMTIPVILYGNSFEEKKEINDVSIKDISVTIAELLNVPKVKEWEGKSLIQ